jgi:hypothetical protein
MLTDSAIRAAKSKTGQTVKLSDGGGLQLWVQPSGSKLWNLAYRFAGKQAQTRDRFISGHRIERSTREAGRGQEAVDLGFRSEPTKAARKVDLGKSEGRYLRGH